MSWWNEVAEHLAAVLEGIEPLEPVDVPLLDAIGLTLAEDVVAPWPLPSFDNGWRWTATPCMRPTSSRRRSKLPVTLPVHGDVAAGATGSTTVARRDRGADHDRRAHARGR